MVYPLDLKPVLVKKNTYFKEGDSIEFNLMIRCKTTTVVKDKFKES
jgi:hypothetical protein